jgi:hypothetical protein
MWWRPRVVANRSLHRARGRNKQHIRRGFPIPVASDTRSTDHGIRLHSLHGDRLPRRAMLLVPRLRLKFLDMVYFPAEVSRQDSFPECVSVALAVCRAANSAGTWLGSSGRKVVMGHIGNPPR